MYWDVRTICPTYIINPHSLHNQFPLFLVAKSLIPWVKCCWRALQLLHLKTLGIRSASMEAAVSKATYATEKRGCLAILMAGYNEI
jgi:hypothetical protein